MRTFIAIQLPSESQTMLATLQETLRGFRADVRWTAIPSIHLTLKFLGEIDPGNVPRMAQELSVAASAEHSFTLRLGGLGAFPNLRNPRVIWCGVQDDSKRLLSLHKTVDAVCVGLGLLPEERDFKPHLTLGRVTGKTNLHPLLEYIKIGSGLESTFTVDHFNIYKSVLQPRGAIYSILERIELGR